MDIMKNLKFKSGSITERFENCIFRERSINWITLRIDEIKVFELLDNFEIISYPLIHSSVF